MSIKDDLKSYLDKKSGGSGGAGGPAGMGGYTPSQAVQDTYNGVKSGAYNSNPIGYDANATNPYQSFIDTDRQGWLNQNYLSGGYGSVAEANNAYNEGVNNARNWNQEQAQKMRESEAWEKDANEYKDVLGLKYIADEARKNNFSDDDMTYIFRMLDNDPQFANMTDAAGNRVYPSEAYAQFYRGDDLGTREDGTHVFSGGYGNVLAEKEAKENAGKETNGLDSVSIKNLENISGKSWGSMDDDEKIYWHAKNGLRDLTRQFGAQWEEARANPSSPYHDIAQKVTNRQDFIDQMMAGNEEALRYQESVSAYEKKNNTGDDSIRQAFEAAAKNSIDRDYAAEVREDPNMQWAASAGTLDPITYDNGPSAFEELRDRYAQNKTDNAARATAGQPSRYEEWRRNQQAENYAMSRGATRGTQQWNNLVAEFLTNY